MTLNNLFVTAMLYAHKETSNQINNIYINTCQYIYNIKHSSKTFTFSNYFFNFFLKSHYNVYFGILAENNILYRKLDLLSFVLIHFSD